MKTCTICSRDETLVGFEPQRRQCVECRKARKKVTRKAYYARTREQSIIAAREWRIANIDHVRLRRKKEYAQNSEAVKEAVRQYRKANPAKINAWSRKHQVARIFRTPKWADHVMIQAYYDVCAFFNEVNGYTKYHVDHIIPLQGKTVSGLHVHNNLQVILASENMSKGNYYATE